MKREDLKALTLTDEQIDKIMALNGQDIEANKTKLTTAEAEAKTAKDQLAEANKQIEAFKGMNIDQIKASAEEWKTKAEKATTDAQKQIDQIRFDHALEGALKDAKVKDAVSVKAHLKVDSLKLNEDGTFLGLKEQLEKIKTEKDFLFEAEGNPPPKIVTGANNQTVNIDTVAEAARIAAGLPSSEGSKK